MALKMKKLLKKGARVQMTDLDGNDYEYIYLGKDAYEEYVFLRIDDPHAGQYHYAKNHLKASVFTVTSYSKVWSKRTEDGYLFAVIKDRKLGKGKYVSAGCRFFPVDEAVDHWSRDPFAWDYIEDDENAARRADTNAERLRFIERGLKTIKEM